MEKRKIIVFGATGGTGQEVVKQALESNFEVTAFARNPAKLEVAHQNLSTAQGDVLKQEEVREAVKGQDAVLCCLGMPATDKSSLRTDGTANILKAMQANGVYRLICQTSLGFGDSTELLPWHMKYFIVPFILKNAFRDHQSQEAAIERSEVDWTIVRPGNMTNGEKTGQYQHGFSSSKEVRSKIKLKISRADVAHFMLEQVSSPQYWKAKVGLSY